ncbi:hypothetical protein H8S90_23300 [Olivibacter sp. SDN3]|uniref:hypothetical protein n=1 Tax=Olivibacter sp. SDN3 TaxID=2764720 RepID=UPI001651A594|nr:hypothetical protein [Olivibacter sp. SDN3]QNL49613.1 hypothetical protein H8S90_23300 [Olivibacter sp. SDN3]
MKEKKVTGIQDSGRNKIMGNPTSDKLFKDQKTLKRHKGLPNAGARSADSGARTDNEKNKN